MKRSSSIQPAELNVHFPLKFKTLLQLEKAKIIQRIKTMIVNNALPVSLNLMPSQSNHCISRSPINSRKSINLKLLQSNKKRKASQEVASFNNICSATSPSLGSKIITQIPVKFISTATKIKHIPYNLLQKLQQDLHVSSKIEPIHYRVQKKDSMSNGFHGIMAENAFKHLHNIYATYSPSNIESTLTHSPLKICQSSRLVLNRPNSTINQKQSRNIAISKAQTNNARRCSMPKIVRPINIEHRNSCLDIGKCASTTRYDVQRAIDDEPLSAWPNEDKK
jgi:hypothetical protein